MSGEAASSGRCRHGESSEHHFTADDYPRPGLWWCPGPDGDHRDELRVVPMVTAAQEAEDDIAW